MRTLTKIVALVFLISLPIALPFMFSVGLGLSFRNLLTPWLLDIYVVLFVLWFVSAMLFSAILLFFPSQREWCLKKLIFLKERDERESFIAGQTAKKVFMLNLAFLLVLLFLSQLTFNISKDFSKPVGKQSTITIGLSSIISPSEETIKKVSDSTTLAQSEDVKMTADKTESATPDPTKKVYFNYNGLPMGPGQLIFWLLVINVLAFVITARKYGKMQE